MTEGYAITGQISECDSAEVSACFHDSSSGSKIDISVLVTTYSTRIWGKKS